MLDGPLPKDVFIQRVKGRKWRLLQGEVGSGKIWRDQEGNPIDQGGFEKLKEMMMVLGLGKRDQMRRLYSKRLRARKKSTKTSSRKSPRSPLTARQERYFLPSSSPHSD